MIGNLATEQLIKLMASDSVEESQFQLFQHWRLAEDLKCLIKIHFYLEANNISTTLTYQLQHLFYNSSGLKATKPQFQTYSLSGRLAFKLHL